MNLFSAWYSSWSSDSKIEFLSQLRKLDILFLQQFLVQFFINLQLIDLDVFKNKINLVRESTDEEQKAINISLVDNLDLLSVQFWDLVKQKFQEHEEQRNGEVPWMVVSSESSSEQQLERSESKEPSVERTTNDGGESDLAGSEQLDSQLLEISDEDDVEVDRNEMEELKLALEQSTQSSAPAIAVE